MDYDICTYREQPGRKCPKWKRTFLRLDDGSFCIPVSTVGMEEKNAVLGLSDEGLGFILELGHAFARCEDLRKVFPGSADLISKVEESVSRNYSRNNP